jgi:uncharacterized protein YjiS (DUF1127 family)
MQQQVDWIEQSPVAARGAVPRRRFRDDLTALGALARLWRRRARERRTLAEMSDHMRRDPGLTEADVLQEATKPFWRP